MLDFRPITPEDRPLIHANLFAARGHGSEYSFANLYFWGDQRMATVEGIPVFLSRFGHWISYLMPQTEDPFIPLSALWEDSQARGIPFRLFGLTPGEICCLERLYPKRFRFHPVRDSFDYVYDISRLSNLTGKKLQSKRNHCNRFLAEHPDYTVQPLTQALLPQCRAFAESWYRNHHKSHPLSDLQGEYTALQRAFQQFSLLEMEGILLMERGEIFGFSMGNAIREDTFDVNFEKARPEVNGAYPMVNREFARRIREKYPQIHYLNREDDMGVAGLRQAKSSYFPDLLLEKFVGEVVE